MVYMFLAEGFEETEATAPLDMLRRAGAEVRLVSVGGSLTVTGSHGIKITADISSEDVSYGDIEMVILPGGMPGADNLFASEDVKKALSAAHEKRAVIAAICAAPYILGRLGYLRGRHAVCYPGYEKELAGAVVEDADVVFDSGNGKSDGVVITARAAGAALEFGFALVKALYGEEKSGAVRRAVIYRK